MKPRPRSDHIPKGPYCYDGSGLCPHWERRADKPEQENGFCRHLNHGDWESEGLSLLWDQVKECGINNEWDEEDDAAMQDSGS